MKRNILEFTHPMPLQAPAILSIVWLTCLTSSETRGELGNSAIKVKNK